MKQNQIDTQRRITFQKLPLFAFFAECSFSAHFVAFPSNESWFAGACTFYRITRCPVFAIAPAYDDMLWFSDPTSNLYKTLGEGLLVCPSISHCKNLSSVRRIHHSHTLLGPPLTKTPYLFMQLSPYLPGGQASWQSRPYQPGKQVHSPLTAEQLPLFKLHVQRF